MKFMLGKCLYLWKKSICFYFSKHIYVCACMSVYKNKWVCSFLHKHTHIKMLFWFCYLISSFLNFCYWYLCITFVFLFFFISCFPKNLKLEKLFDIFISFFLVTFIYPFHFPLRDVFSFYTSYG